MPTITCKIPAQLDHELTAVAGNRGVAKSAVIREALEQSLERHQTQGALSAHDVMKPACGIVRGGQRDRATHPKHLKGFGR